MIWHSVMFSAAGLLDASSSVLDRVALIAHGLQARIELFDCLHDQNVAETALTDAELREAIRNRVVHRRRQVELFADALRAHSVQVNVSVRWDYPLFEAITRQVLRHKPDLLIVPTQRASRIEQRLLSYTDHRLIETCPCPLLLLRGLGSPSPGTVLAAVDPADKPNRIRLDETIIGAADTMAHALGDRPVHVCHFVAAYSQGVAGGVVVPETVAGAHADNMARLQAATQRIRSMAALHGVPQARVHVELGSVEDGIVRRSHELLAEILVMGAVSRSLPPGRTSLTPRAERLLDAVGCDVLVLKPDTFRTPVTRRPRATARSLRQTGDFPE